MVAHGACPDVRDCQHRASTWEDGAWVGVGMGWGNYVVATYALGKEGATPMVAGPLSLGSFALSVPLMAAAASPSKRAVALSSNALTLELRRRPKWWTVYGLGLGMGTGAFALHATHTGPWWLHTGVAGIGAGLFTASAAGFAHDSRWIRRQATLDPGPRRKRLELTLVPTPTGMGLLGRY